MEKKSKRESWRASLAQKTAQIANVSPRYVRMVVKGERENENVMSVYMRLMEGENKLLAQVKELIPFE